MIVIGCWALCHGGSTGLMSKGCL